MFAYATGGPFGLEDMVTTSGPGLTLLYHLFIPFFWCIPVSLVAAELTTAIPVEGGFYRWVRAAFGDFWGFLAGWWNWSASFLLAAAYAVLTTDYLSFYFTAIVGWKHHLVSVIIIATIAWINARGIQMVGAVSTVLELFVLLVIATLCAIGAAKWHHNPFGPLVPPHVPPFQVFGAGLALGLWLYSGYEQVSSVAEEVESPQRSYPRALAIVVPLSMATYFLPTMFSLAALGDWQKWHTGYFSEAAALIGGAWLGFAMTIAAMVTNLSLLNATVLTSTRMPLTLAEVGSGTSAGRPGDVFCVSEITGRKSRRRPATYVKKSRILYQAPARGSAQVLPLRSPRGAAGNLIPSKRMSLGSPQMRPASFAPNQVAAATPWPAKPAAKYMPSICPACGITSIVKSRVPPQTNSTFTPRSRGYTAIMPRRRISALRRTVSSVAGKCAARPPKSMRLSGVSR